MNCQTFKAVVQDIDVPGGVEETMREDALTHAENCLRCARRLRNARALTVALGALARADESREAPPRVEDRVRLAFRVQSGERRRPRRFAWAMAAAALAISLGAGLLWRQTAAPVPAGSQTAIEESSHIKDQLAAMPQPAAPQADSQHAVKPKPSHQTRTSRRLRRRPTQQPAAPREPQVLPTQEMADFLPLPFADREEPLDAGAIVRIELSERSLGLLGLPVTEPVSSQPVTADVVLGQDGTARAIRFVSGPLPSGLGQQLQSIAF